MKLAIDVSRYQRGLPVTTRHYDISGVVIRTSDWGVEDRYYKDNIEAHKKYPISLYHFWRANYNVDVQVSIVMKLVQYAEKVLGYQPKFAIDVENTTGINIVGKGTAIKRLYEFSTKLDEHLDNPTYIYTSKSKWKDLFDSYTKIRYRKEFKYLTDKYLWNAVYFTSDVLEKDKLDEILNRIKNGLTAWYIPDGDWKEMIMWQIGYTNAIISGANVDVDIVYNDWAFQHKDEPPTPQPTLEERVAALEEKVASCC